MNKSEFARFACEKIFNSWVDKNEWRVGRRQSNPPIDK
jgi:hypothetical protein